MKSGQRFWSSYYIISFREGKKLMEISQGNRDREAGWAREVNIDIFQYLSRI